MSRGVKRVDWRAGVEANLDGEAARKGRGLVTLAGRRAWEAWSERGNSTPPTLPESEWLALGGLLS